MHLEESASVWARKVFGSAALGDARRTRRAISMATAVAKAPAGRVGQVFLTAAEKEGAYDFLENDQVDERELGEAMGRAVARRAAACPFVYVPIDGSSIRVVDKARKKGFGIVGTAKSKAPGLKVITAMGAGPDGATLGVFAQHWWARTPQPRVSATKHRSRNRKRRTHEKETQRWLDVIDDVRRHCQATGAKGWIQIDREGDAGALLTALSQTGLDFTIRSAWDRKLSTTSGERLYLTDELERRPVVARYDVDVPPSKHRKARVARMHVKAMVVELRLSDHWRKTWSQLRVTVVEATEYGTTPKGEAPLSWRLLTNHPVGTDGDVLDVIRGYTMRWRIEDLHRTWKSGGCNVEEMQLRSKTAAIKWARILVAVAARIERLKHLARTQPDVSATGELSDVEIRALILLKRKYGKRSETITDDVPTIATAVRWIAELGGYTGKSSGGPPGSITIGRGLEKLSIAADLLAKIDDAGK